MIVNKEFLDEKMTIENVTLSKNSVVYRVKDSWADDVDSIKALVDIEVISINDAGTYNVDDLELVAYDDKGRVIEDIEIVGDIDAEVDIASYSKEVPIKVVPTGELISGKAISSILVNGAEYQTVIIYGSEKALEKVNYVETSIDVTGQGNNGSKKYKVTLSKPEGVRALSKQIANIEVGFGEAKQMTFNVSGIMIKNLSDGLVANLVSSSDSNVEVKAIGTEDILSNLDTSIIKAYVDLQSMDVGTHEVQVEVESNDTRIQFIVTKRVDIVITKK
jgi:YbbR domain-containing protein